jgi:hypothetical protein
MVWTIKLLLVASMAMLVSSFVRAEEICSVLKNPGQYDHQMVTVQGTASAVAETTSRRGNDYTTFRVRDANGCTVKVFSWGHPGIKNGDGAEVIGTYEQVKHVGTYTFYNEIDAKSVRPSPTR